MWFKFGHITPPKPVPTKPSYSTERLSILGPKCSAAIPSILRMLPLGVLASPPKSGLEVLHLESKARWLKVERDRYRYRNGRHVFPHKCYFEQRGRRRGSNPSGKCSQERLTRGRVTRTMRREAYPYGCARCGAGAG